MRKAWLIMAALMVASGNLYAQGGSAQQDSLALVALYTATDGDNWTNNTNWLTGPVSTWLGVTVENGRLTDAWSWKESVDGGDSGGVGQSD